MRLMMLAHSDAYWTPFYAHYFVKRGDTLLLVSFSPDRIEGIDMEFVGNEPFHKDKNKHLFITRVPRVCKIYHRFRPDLVYAPYLASDGLTAVLACRRPIVVGAVGGDVLNQLGWVGAKRRLHEMRTRFVCRRAEVIHTHSEEINSELIRLGIPASKLALIPVGSDVERYHPHREMPRPKATRFICTRKHETVYDIPTIIRALGRLKASGRDFHCVFTCTGTLLEKHKELARSLDLGDRVTFTGQVSLERLQELLREADVYISASLSDGTSTALLEAMLCGLVPVVSRIRANLPWIEDGRTGLFFETGRSDDLATALSKVMDDPGFLRRALLENPPRIAGECNMHRNVERLASVFDRVVQTFRGRN